jgi:predicted nuclease of restriction endonuclease-like (RecB) superfamily
MDSGKDLHEAEMYAKKGLDSDLDLQTTILDHFVVADIYNRLGKSQDANQHVREATKLQKKLTKK